MLIGLIVGAELELNVAGPGEGTIRGAFFGVASNRTGSGSGVDRASLPFFFVSGFTTEPSDEVVASRLVASSSWATHPRSHRINMDQLTDGRL
jgi:hypothetical protein